jgi:hypothetical protein
MSLVHITDPVKLNALLKNIASWPMYTNRVKHSLKQTLLNQQSDEYVINYYVQDDVECPAFVIGNTLMAMTLLFCSSSLPIASISTI